MTWTAPHPPELAAGPTTGPERAVLQGMLDHHRGALLRICAGLTADQLVARPLPSSLSLLGLVRHLTKVEQVWFRIRVAGLDLAPLHPGTDTDLDGATAEGAEADLATYLAECLQADEAVAPIALEHEITHRGDVLSHRLVLLHVIEEHARHDGHADLLREAIDGVTGR